MKKIFTILSVLLMVLCLIKGANAQSNQQEIQVLRNNLEKSILKRVPGPDQIKKELALLKPDGTFSDLDYNDRTRGGWPLHSHLGRILDWSIAWKTKGNAVYQSPTFKLAMFDALNWWLKNDPINPNWWYPQIGVPQTLGQLMIILQPDLSAEQIRMGLTILNRSKIGMTGQNKVWLAQNVIYRSLITNESKQIEEAAKVIYDEIIVSEGEGIQSDFSFHQHGPQQQFGNYGLAFASDMYKWAVVFQGTPFAFPNDKIAILRNYLTKGMKWMVWRDRFDISGCGRQLFPDAQIGKAHSALEVLKGMKNVDPAHREEYDNAINPFRGNTHFWRSDMSVHRSPDFYASVKMSSSRVAGAESCNTENLQGYYMGDGATFFYQSGDEYLDIFPFWNWKKIPGTTVVQNKEKLPVLTAKGYFLPTDFVGGVSDNQNGIATMAYRRDSLEAQKSWFFYRDAVVALGSNIRTSRNEIVTTSINQSYLKGAIDCKYDGVIQTKGEGACDLPKTEWVIQDNWGYYFPGRANLHLESGVRKGAWTNLVAQLSPKEMQASIFQLEYNHGKKPQGATYCYVVLPKATKANIEDRGKAFKIIANEPLLQAIETTDEKWCGVVFYAPGSCQVNGHLTLSVKQPCVMMMTKDQTGLRMYLSDPTHKQQKIEVSLSGKHTFKGSFNSSYDQNSNKTTLTIQLPVGPEAGKTVSII